LHVKLASGWRRQGWSGRDHLTGRKRWVSRQVPGQTKASHRQAKKVEAELLECVDRGELDSAGLAAGSDEGNGRARYWSPRITTRTRRPRCDGVRVVEVTDALLGAVAASR
jgi:hypothetical protein